MTFILVLFTFIIAFNAGLIVGAWWVSAMTLNRREPGKYPVDDLDF